MLVTIDWVIIAAYFLVSLAIGLYYRKKASGSMSDFFLGGRSMPWYIAGLSMVATTFAADTPLAVTELVAKNGISGNWLWWSFLFGGMLTTFFFAKLWRRAEVMTEVELIELRYSGQEAAILRGAKAVYLGLFMNVLIIGWVNVALNTILSVFFGIPADQVIYYTAAAMIITAVYSSISGLWGVAITDVIQFGIAMLGTVLLAIFVVNSDKVGGISGLQQQLADKPWAFDFFPTISNSVSGNVGALTITVGAFLAYIAVQWWASWYPGAEPGGGGYVAQRIMSAKDEKNSIYATLFFQIAHYCLRPWPWILVGLATIVLYPHLGADEKRVGYVMAMKDYLPNGFKGMLVVAFLAAYMSTISTQLNWGASYLVNDLYKRFFRPANTFGSQEQAEKQYVFASRLVTLLLMAVALGVTPLIGSISGVWSFIIECGAGLGLVLILRWYWWRINAWSEIAATVAPFVAFAVSKFVLHWEFPNSFFLTVGFTTVAWLVVTYITPPSNMGTLQHFYQKVRPDGAWDPVAQSMNMERQPSQVANLVVCWLSAVAMTYSTLFFTGKVIFGDKQQAGIWGIVAVVSFLVLKRFMGKTRIFE